MAEVVLSAVLPVLLESLTSAALKTIARYKGIDAEIKKLHRSLTLIQDVLADASQKEITSQSVKRWLNDLQHLAYEIDDVLDDLATDAMEREFTPESEPSSKVRKLISSYCINFPKSTKMLDKLDSINAKLQEFLKEKADLGLRVIEEPRPRIENRRFQSSVFDPSGIVGRQGEKEALIQQLLQADGPPHQKFGIVPIFGMGGVGKTTLASLLYYDQRVKEHFELKGWVCISDDFDIFGRTKDIFISMGGELKESENFNKLQEALRDYVRGKRFLLVLDDVWFECYTDWRNLVAPLFTCAPESKIVITTRKDQLLKRLGYDPLNKQLESLSYDDALSLFALHALGVKNFDSHLSLKPHGIGIVKKCGRLPLALITLGTSLKTKEDEDSWKRVLESEIWNLPVEVEKEILPALRLSYHELSAALKQVFAYCSLFPKDFLFDKEELVLLWMAEGFLQQSTQSRSTKEKLGHEYFDELLSRSFFQYAPSNESLFVMHDLINDLATHVAGEFFIRLDIEAKKDTKEEMLEKYRHMSFVREKHVTYKKFEAFNRAKGLRTFLATSVGVVNTWDTFKLSNKILVDLLSEILLLRVLSLSYFDISEVPESIGTLRHLRYLNLSQTSIKILPENVSNLYKLETLILSGCRSLAKLPNNFSKLKNLRHLDIRETPCLNEMPLGIGELKSLQTLSKIIIGGKSGFEITKLKEFENLCGEVLIMDLDKVQNATDARVANFPQKKLSKLKVVWSEVWDDSQNEMLEKDVLKELKPHNDKLIESKISSYGGSEFPKWVGDPLFKDLKHVSLSGCNKCTSLPPLAQLNSLKGLLIEDLDGVKAVGMELLGTCRAFPSLEILTFNGMNEWEKWSIDNGEDVFPCLKQLFIKNCPNLVEVTLEKILEIRCCDKILEREWGRQNNNNRMLLEDVSIYRWPNLKSIINLNCLVHLTRLEILDCEGLESLPDNEFPHLASLKHLVIKDCPRMDGCFPRGLWPPYLQFLQIGRLKKPISEWGSQNFPTSLVQLSLFDGGEDGVSSCSQFSNLLPSSLTFLTLVNFEKLESFSMGLQHLQSLTFVKCPNLHKLSDPKHLNNSLQHLYFYECPNMKDLPEQLLPSLLSLDIRGNCPNLKERCRKGGSYWPLVSHIPYLRHI